MGVQHTGPDETPAKYLVLRHLHDADPLFDGLVVHLHWLLGKDVRSSALMLHVRVGLPLNNLLDLKTRRSQGVRDLLRAGRTGNPLTPDVPTIRPDARSHRQREKRETIVRRNAEPVSSQPEQ